MQFPNATKYTSGLVTQMKKNGKPVKGKYRLILKHKNEAGEWVSSPSKVVNADGKKDAVRLLIAFQEEQDKLAGAVPKYARKVANKTIEQALREYLLYQRDTTQELTPTTHMRQIGTAQVNVFPYIGEIKVSKLTVTAIEQWWTDLSNAGKSQSTIKNEFEIVAKMYRHHFKTEQIDYNPFEHMTRWPKKPKADVTHLTDDNINEMFLALNDKYLEGEAIPTGVSIALLTGMRRAEICGLRWRNVNFNSLQITVDTSVARTPEGYVTKEPKTDTGYRTFSIVGQLLSILNARIAYVKKTYHIEEIPPNWFVIGDSEFMTPLNFGNAMHRLAKQYNLKDFKGDKLTLKSMRHNFATLALANNVDIKTVQHMLGHATAAMTLDTYADVNQSAMVEGAAILGDAFMEEGLGNLELMEGEDRKPTAIQIEKAIEVLKRAGYDTSKLVKVY